MPVVQPLPDRPNLTNLRKQAKALLAAWQAGDRQALARVRDFHPGGERLITTGRHALADAQLVVARGYGFGSWAHLVRHLRLAPAAQARHTIDMLFQATIAPNDAANTVEQVLGRRAGLVWQAYLDGHPVAARLLREAEGAEGFDEVVSRGLTLDDARSAIAWDHGFADWAAVAAHRDLPVGRHFEAAADAIVSGDLDTLRALLDTHPALAQSRSPFGHHATLVHYVAANGVEGSRQWQSPGNAVEILRILLRHGGDPDAICDAYGGGSGVTPLYLLVSSAHPAAAGVQAGLVRETLPRRRQPQRPRRGRVAPVDGYHLRVPGRRRRAGPLRRPGRQSRIRRRRG